MKQIVCNYNWEYQGEKIGCIEIVGALKFIVWGSDWSTLGCVGTIAPTRFFIFTWIYSIIFIFPPQKNWYYSIIFFKMNVKIYMR